MAIDKYNQIHVAVVGQWGNLRMLVGSCWFCHCPSFEVSNLVWAFATLDVCHEELFAVFANYTDPWTGISNRFGAGEAWRFPLLMAGVSAGVIQKVRVIVAPPEPMLRECRVRFDHPTAV